LNPFAQASTLTTPIFRGRRIPITGVRKSGVTLEEVYNFSSDNENVLGLEAPVWTEFVHTDEALDNRFWPRTIAVAELAWSENTSKDYTEFVLPS
jgi:hexosaminidase